MKRILIPLAALVAGLSVGRTAVTFVGNDLTTGPSWRTPAVTKVNDLDGDNIYGTAGYYLPAGLRSGYEATWLANNIITGPSNDDDINALPGFITSFEFTDPAERGRSWGGSGGNFGTLDNVGGGHTGFTGAPILRRDASAAPMSVTLKRVNSPAFRLTLIVGSANEGGFNNPAGQDFTVDDGSGPVMQNSPIPGNSAATTYQSWDISAGSSDIIVAITGQPVGVGVARLAGLAIDVDAAVAPVIQAHPAGGTCAAGGSFGMTVTALGTAPITYSWYKDGALLPAPSLPSLTFPALAVEDSGSYRVVVGNSAGSVTSNPALLVVADGLPSKTLAYQAAIQESVSLISEYAFNNSDVTDALGIHDGTVVGGTVFGTGPGGGADKALVLNGAGHARLGSVTDFEFSSGAGAVEAWVRADWSVELPPPYNPCIIACRNGGPTRWSIHLLQAKNQLALWNGTAVAIAPIPPAGTGWHHLASSFDNGTWSVYWDGALVGVYAIGLGVAGQPTQIGSASDATTTEGWMGALDEVALYNAPLSAEEVAMHYNSFVIGDPPVIAGQPASSCTLAGDATRLAVIATGAQLGYQWYKDGEPLDGATANVIEFPAVATTDAGSYQVVVSNPVGNATSSVATVTVLVPDVAAYRSAVAAQPGLVSLYTFDDGEPLDAVGLNDGTFVGTTAISAGLGGSPNQALTLNAAGHVALGGVPEFSFPGGAGTVEGLVRATWVTDPPYAPCLFANRDGGPTRWSIHLIPNKVQLAFWNGAAVGIVPIPHAGTGWHHLASVFDAGTWRVYWDGQLVGVTATPLGNADGLTTQIGSSSAGTTTEGWVGDLDEIAVYDTALSDGVISRHFSVLAAPRLTITRSAAQVTLAWPASAAGFALESAGDPDAAEWSPVTDVAGNTATLPATGAPRFFRLRKP